MAIVSKIKYLLETKKQNDLLKELKDREARHKYNVLKKMMVKYYTDLKETNCKGIVDYIANNEPEHLASIDVMNLILKPDMLCSFNRLYKIAYDRLAEEGEI